MISASQWLASKNTYFCRGFYGPTGDTGNQGDQGLNGIEGNTGNNGNPGETGSQGQGGLLGNTGNSGTSGIVGEQGLSGVSGITTQGYLGNQGIAGEQGVVGSASSGIRGFSNNIGTSGIVGNQGLIGLIGEQGYASPGMPTIAGGVVNSGNGDNNYVYTFPQFVENNTSHKGHYRFIAYIYKDFTPSGAFADTESLDVTSNHVTFDFIIFPTTNGQSKFIYVACTRGTPLLDLFQNELYVGFKSRQDALADAYYWKLYKLNVGF